MDEWICHCRGCIYYRQMSNSTFACHYCIDTGIIRGIDPHDCYKHTGTPYSTEPRKYHPMPITGSGF